MTYPTNLSRHGFDARVVEPTGTGSNGCYLIGEAPGEWESRDGIPFHPKAPAGSTLERLFRRAGLSRDHFRISNVVWQRPPRNYLENAPWEAEAVETWRPHLLADIESVKPRVLICAGNVALRALTEYGGKNAGVASVRGYVLPSAYGAWVIPTLHPSYILQGNQDESGVVIYDLTRALEIAKSGFERQPVRYLTPPSLDDALTFERGYDPARHTLSYDIETPESSRLDEEAVEEKGMSWDIIRVSLCYEARYAMSVPWQHPFISIVKRMLSTDGRKRTWNGESFDNPRLRQAGCEINGREYDLMWGWHFLQPGLRRALAYVAPFYGDLEPWKHLSDSQPEYYSCCDADALQRIGDGLEHDLRSQGKWERYESHVIDVHRVLHKMSANGLPYSSERASAFRTELEGKYDERFQELQTLIPLEMKPVHPKNGYKKKPKSTEGMRLIHVRDLVKQDGKLVEWEGERWAKVLLWLPTSWQQVQAYAKLRGHKLPKARKTQKETTEENALRKLARRHKDRVYDLTVECRQLRKVLGTYVNGWKPASDGRIHAEPGFWGKMFRISWRSPNLAATIADKTEEHIARGFRKCVTAREGYVLGERDWRAIEAQLVGWFAGDPDFMRLSALGIHSFILSHHPAINEPADAAWNDERLTEHFAVMKKRSRELYDHCKHITYLSLYGGTPRTAAQLYNIAEREAKQIQGLLWSLFPKVRAWQKNVMERAHQEARLTNPYGYTQWFWNVFTWDSKRGDWMLGPDAKSAVSFLPRDTAAGMLKAALLRLEPLADEGVLLSSTHDALLWECRERDFERVDEQVRSEMERPIKELGNLVVKTTGKRGRSWADDEMEEI